MTFKVMEPPIRTKIDGENGINREWVEWVSRVYTVANAVSQSGTTANRPTKLFVGQSYFDVSLGANGKRIFVDKNGTGWVDATGASV